MNNLTEYSSWAKEFQHDWLEEKDYTPSLKVIKNKNWHALPIADNLLALEAEWLAEAVNALGVKEMLGINFECQGEPCVSKVDVGRDAILNFLSEYSYNFCILTTKRTEFLFYKEQGNEYLVIAGPLEFIKQAYKCSHDTAKIMFYDCLINQVGISGEAKSYYTELWDRYAVTFS